MVFFVSFYDALLFRLLAFIKWHLPDVEQLQACSSGGCVSSLEPKMDDFDDCMSDVGHLHQEPNLCEKIKAENAVIVAHS